MQIRTCQTRRAIRTQTRRPFWRCQVGRTSWPGNLSFPTEIIQRAVWLYHCFSLSLRGVELILAARGVVISYETVRE